MRLRYAVIILILAGLPSLVCAEFYKYRDGNGVLRFTDNLSEVPKDQRPEIKTYKEADDFLAPWQREEKARREAVVSEEARGAAREAEGRKINVPKTQIGSTPDDLKRIKAGLDREFDALMQRKQAVDAEKAALRTKDRKAAKACLEKAKQLNADIREFEQRRQAFQKKADAFNAGQKMVLTK
ncbi:MAG: hypothetical protein U9Q38_05325 [Thermodesulfobacteriota bacterium]|nr:hypothetical protein [Thermodesulfobacteriota bacterium]